MAASLLLFSLWGALGIVAVWGIDLVPNSYIILNNTDAPNMDIGQVGTLNFTYMMEVCNTDNVCMGFNSNGWLKFNVSATVLAPSEGTQLYIRQNAVPQAPVTLLWPLPQQFTFGSTAVGIDSTTFRFTSPHPFADLLDAFRRYKDVMFAHATLNRPTGPVLDNLVVNVANSNVPLQLNVDESYTLTIPDDGSAATLNANTYYGALRGLETFSQLVTFDFTSLSYQLALAPWSVKDQPRFSHRGLLVDTSRHFEPIRTLKRVIQAMTYSKMNVLHWHLSDTESFPLQSTTYPDLWNGSYSAYERISQADAADLVEFARKRGVRVVPEFDVPGHAGSWCAGYPDVCPSPVCNQPLNPATSAVFDLMTSFFGELTGAGSASNTPLFFDNMFHLGGDEVNTDCWTTTPSINTWLSQNNFTAQDAYGYFVEKAHQIIIAQNRNPVNWEEVFLNFGSKLDPQTIVHVWLDHATLAEVVAAGYRGILSNNDVWYLDHLSTTWQQFYANDPLENITVPAQQALVLGGEVCMWGETVDTSDIEQTIWPRAAAAAERLWSAATVNDATQALPRLMWFRCLLNQREVAAAPVNNDEARNSPSGPGPCGIQ